MPTTALGYSPYAAEQATIERRRKLAELLQQQSMQPIEQQTAGGRVVPISPFQGIAKMLQAYSAAQGTQRADEQMRALGEKVTGDRASTLAKALQAGRGTPDQTVDVSDPFNQEPTPQTVTVPGTKGSPQEMYSMLARSLDPALQQAGMTGLMQDAQRQSFMQSAQAPQQGGPPSGGPVAPSGGKGGPMAPGVPQTPPTAPQGQPAGFGGPAGGVPMATWLQSDPSGKAYIEQLAKDHAERIKPIVGRENAPVLERGPDGQLKPSFFMPKVGGGMQPTFGPGGVTSVAPLPGFTAGRAAIVGAEEGAKAAHDIVTVQVGDREVQMTRADAAKVLAQQNPIPGGQGPLPNAAEYAATLTDPQEKQAFTNAATRGGTYYVDDPNKNVSQQPPLPANRTLGERTPRPLEAASTEASKEFIKEMRDNYGKLRDAPVAIANIEKARALVPNAQTFMGPLGQVKLAVTKFFRANVPGFENFSTDNVGSAEELRSAIFMQIMDNLKKMDAQPSQQQQLIMQESLGNLGTDPAALPRVLDVFKDVIQGKISIHNETVDSALQTGVRFPYDVRVKPPKAQTPPTVAPTQTPRGALSPAEQQELNQLRQRLRR